MKKSFIDPRRKIYFLTVHWQTPEWIDLQVRQIRKYAPEPYEIWAILNGIAPRYRERFDRIIPTPESWHPLKLNLLAKEVSSVAENKDILCFIDGDAFPIAPFDHLIKTLEEYPLVAVQRTEQLGDIQPHPCFCLTTMGFWQQIRGDWRPGYTWSLDNGRQVTDVGGNLLQKLRENYIQWKPIHRTNKRDIHPLFYGIYGNAIYHHGAGFRRKVSRLNWVTGMDVVENLLASSYKKVSHTQLPYLKGIILRVLRAYCYVKYTPQSRRVRNRLKKDINYLKEEGMV